MLGPVRALVAAIVGLALAAVVVILVAGDSTAGKGIALALAGIACVLGVSGAFLAVGRSEDAAREAEAKPPPEHDPRTRGPRWTGAGRCLRGGRAKGCDRRRAGAGERRQVREARIDRIRSSVTVIRAQSTVRAGASVGVVTIGSPPAN